MKNLFTTLTLLLITFYASFASLPPTITLAPLITNSFCTSSSASLGFTADTYPSGHTYAVQLSDSNGSFSGTPTVLGTGQSSLITFVLPSYSSGTTSNYKLRITDQNDVTRVSGASEVIYFESLSVSLETLNGSPSTSVCQGSSLKIYAKLNLPNINGVSYEWYRNDVIISGIITSNYTANQNGGYKVKVSKAGCLTYISQQFTSFYTDKIPSIYNSPNEFLCTGNSTIWKSSYEAENAVFEWKRNNTIISGETSPKLTINQSGLYSSKITDLNCSPTSLTTTKQFNVGSIISTNISVGNSGVADTLIICPNYASYSMYYLYGDLSDKNSYSYQWRFNGNDLPYETNYNVRASSEGIYSLKVTQGNCSAVSKNVYVKNSLPNSIKIEAPYGTQNCIGNSIFVQLTGVEICGTYQWQKDGIDIPSQVSDNISATQTGNYRLKINRNGNIIYSNSISLTFSNTPSFKIITFDTPIANKCVAYGSYYMLGGFPFGEFQWYKNNLPINGETGVSYAMYSPGVYKIRVSYGSCVGYSQDVNITISNQLSKPLIKSYRDKIVCSNTYIPIFTDNFPNTGTVYEWKKDGQSITNSNNYSLDATQSGNYTVTVTQGTCTATSDSFPINIGNKQQSIKNSNWNDATMWSCGTVPTIAEDALINKGHTISIPNNYTGFVKDLQVNGVLQYGNNALLKSRTN